MYPSHENEKVLCAEIEQLQRKRKRKVVHFIIIIEFRTLLSET